MTFMGTTWQKSPLPLSTQWEMLPYTTNRKATFWRRTITGKLGFVLSLGMICANPFLYSSPHRMKSKLLPPLFWGLKVYKTSLHARKSLKGKWIKFLDIHMTSTVLRVSLGQSHKVTMPPKVTMRIISRELSPYVQADDIIFSLAKEW